MKKSRSLAAVFQVAARNGLPAFANRLEAISAKPWRTGFKNLLAKLCHAYAPTLDSRWAVAKLESMFRLGGPQGPQPKDDPFQIARFFGHLAALWDYELSHSASEDRAVLERTQAELAPSHLDSLRRRTSREWSSAESRAESSAEADRWEAGTKAGDSYVQLLAMEHVRALRSFRETERFFAEYSRAHRSTLTPTGQLKGQTDATGRISQFLVASMLFVAADIWPRTVRECYDWL